MRLIYVSQVTRQVSTFDGSNRQGVRQDGGLSICVGAGICTTFAYNSNKNLVAQYYDAGSCSKDMDPLLSPSSTMSGPQGSSCE